MLRKALPILILALAGSQAYAEPWAHVRQTPGTPFPTIHVYSDNGTQWDRVGDVEAGLTFRVDARGQCDERWRTQRDSFLKVRSGGQEVANANLAINTDHRSYGPDHGQGWKELTFSGPVVNPQSPSTAPAAMCNAWLASSSSGAPNPQERRRQLLASGLTQNIQRAYRADFYLSCQKNSFNESRFALAEADLSAKVVCHGNPAALDVPEPAQLELVPVPGIREMRLWVNPNSAATFSGFCPKTLHFGGEIEYLVPPGGTVNLKYRYVATSGARVIKSDQYTTTFTTSGKKILHGWPLGFPLSTGELGKKAPAASDTPDVFGGSVVLEFVGAVPIHANLQPAQFRVTCVKEGTVAVPLAGGDTKASPMPPREPIQLGEPQPPTRQPTSRSVASPAAATAAVPAAGTPAAATLIMPKADLVIRSAAPVAGTDRALRVRVANQGAASSAASQLTLFLPDGKPIRASVGPIPARGQQDVILRAPIPLTGLRPLRLHIDEAGRVAEVDEGNNTFVLAAGAK